MTATVMTVAIDATGRRATAHLTGHPDDPIHLSGADENQLMTTVFERAHTEARATGTTVTVEIDDERTTTPGTEPLRLEVDPDQSIRPAPSATENPDPEPTLPQTTRRRTPPPVVRIDDNDRPHHQPAAERPFDRDPADRGAPVLPRRPPAPTPPSVPTAPTADRRAGSPATRGVRGRLNAALGLKLAAGSVEQDVRAAASVISGPVPDSATVAVVNVKGGAGKTPITLALASQLAALRGPGTVTALDLGEANNSFADRTATPGPPGHDTIGLLDLYDRSGRTITPATLGRYLIRQPSGEDVLSGRHDDVEVGYDDAQRLGSLLAQYRDLLIVDTGNGEKAGRWRWAVTTAQVVLVPVPLRVDVLGVVRRMVHRIAELRPNGLDGVVVLITHGPGDTPAVEADEIDRLIRADGIDTVLRMPFEPVFASGEPITAQCLAPGTRDALTRLGSHIVGSMTAGAWMG